MEAKANDDEVHSNDHVAELLDGGQILALFFASARVHSAKALGEDF